MVNTSVQCISSDVFSTFWSSCRYLCIILSSDNQSTPRCLESGVSPETRALALAFQFEVRIKSHAAAGTVPFHLGRKCYVVKLFKAGPDHFHLSKYKNIMDAGRVCVYLFTLRWACEWRNDYKNAYICRCRRRGCCCRCAPYRPGNEACTNKL